MHDANVAVTGSPKRRKSDVAIVELSTSTPSDVISPITTQLVLSLGSQDSDGLRQILSLTWFPQSGHAPSAP